MIKTSITFKRPNTNISWHSSPELGIISSEFKQFFMAYMHFGKILHTTSVESNDRLTYTSIAYWLNQDTIDQFNQDPTVEDIFNKRNSYYESVNVEVGALIIIEVDRIDPNDLQ